MVSIYSVYARGSKGRFEHIGDDTRSDLVQAAIQELKRMGYEVRASIIRVRAQD